MKKPYKMFHGLIDKTVLGPRRAKMFRGLPKDFGVTSVAFSPHAGGIILTGSSDEMAKLWNIKTGLIMQIYRHKGIVTSVAFSPHADRIILTGSLDGTARLWDIKTEKTIKTFKHQEGVTSVAFSPHSDRIILTGSLDGTTKLWVKKLKKAKILEGHRKDFEVTSVTFNFKRGLILTGSLDGTAGLWKLRDLL